ncbi:hypothetical protein [Phenylobacterium deserti]|uniref:Uncharacterized protein n=1 Tax=Phenylobacterium deserti TaxID=1914756 RepID=A0A328AUQ0_9CAUL|nr:hypothetical protein [Phenylobacterium deserti]RAK56658.1 hypothetical protein DJ018_01375 [Phenylobacterium deserti]
MISLLAALALFSAQAPAAADPSVAAPPASASNPDYPAGAPTEPYQFVSWCYGMLRGYVDRRDEVWPEVRRIESTYRKPGSNLAEDLKVYDNQLAQAQKDLVLFQRAMTAAEKASLRPINTLGARALRKGMNQWSFGENIPAAQRAQAWMGWTLPAMCQTQAAELEKRAVLMGASFQVNADPVTAEAPASATP